MHHVLQHPKIECLPLPASLSSLRGLLNWIRYIPTSTSQPMNRVSAAIAPPSRSTASTSTTSKYSSNLDRSWPPSASSKSLDHGLQVHLWVTRSRPPNATPNSLDHGLQAHLWFHSTMTSKCISKLDHDHGLQVRTIMASKCISKLTRLRPQGASLSSTWSRPPSASPNSLEPVFQMHLWVQLDLSLQVHLWVPWCQPPNASPNPLDHGL